jgi:hypothetical protein
MTKHMQISYRFAFLAIFTASLSVFSSQAGAAFAELGAAGQYTVLTTSVGNNGANVDIGSGATDIYGDVALGPNSTGAAIKATIHGNLFVDSSSTTDMHTDLSVTGSTFVNQNLAGANTAAFSASNYFAQLAPMQTFGNVSGDTIFSGASGLNVFSLSSVNEQGTLTISGNASSKFVFNISGGFILNGGSIVLAGGVTADNVLFNFNGSGNGITLNKPVGDAMGIFLAPQREIILDKATLIGAIIGGGDGNKVVIHSGATLISAVPEVTPSSVIFGFLGLIVAVSSRRVLAGRVGAVAKK